MIVRIDPKYGSKDFQCRECTEWSHRGFLLVCGLPLETSEIYLCDQCLRLAEKHRVVARNPESNALLAALDL